MTLPPGQRVRSDFPRFGLWPYAERFPREISQRRLTVRINAGFGTDVDFGELDVPRVQIQRDFHCVTTWTYTKPTWSGVRFADFYRAVVEPLIASPDTVEGAVLYSQDGYKTSLPLTDLLCEDVLLADELDGEPLSVEHGAPLRLIAPDHYGYKNVKSLERVEFFVKLPRIKRGLRSFLDHPRARVACEERGRWFPGWLLRRLYRPLIPGTVNKFRVAMQRHAEQQQEPSR